MQSKHAGGQPGTLQLLQRVRHSLPQCSKTQQQHNHVQAGNRPLLCPAGRWVPCSACTGGGTLTLCSAGRWVRAGGKRAAPSPLASSKKLRNSTTLSAKYRADQYTDFYASGDKLFCKCCQHTVDWTRKNTCDDHIASKSHVRNKEKHVLLKAHQLCKRP